MKAGWQVKPLGEVCEIYQPKTISKKDMVDDGAYPVFGANGTIGRYDKFNHEAPQLLITCRGATCGSVNVSEPFSWITGNSMVVRPIHANLDQEYLKYFFLGAVDLTGVITGAAQPQITRASLSPVSLCIPPLEEQKRIVAVLDAAFEGLTRAKENSETNLQNARELFGAFLEQLFLKNGEKWSTAPLQDTVTKECTLSYGIVQPGEDVEGGLPVVRPTDLRKPLIGKIGLKTIAPEKADGYARTQLTGDEILLCVRGTTGVVAKALPELEGGNVTRGIVPVRFDPEKMLQDFGYYQFRSRHIQEQIEAQTYGAALRQINIRDLKKISFVFPKVAEQEKLLPLLQDSQKKCEDLVGVCEAKLTDIADLRQSLLQKAFAGELT